MLELSNFMMLYNGCFPFNPSIVVCILIKVKETSVFNMEIFNKACRFCYNQAMGRRLINNGIGSLSHRTVKRY